METTAARVTHGLPFESYQALDSVHFSTLKTIDVSALHYLRARDAERKDTSALRVGRALHSLLLDADPPGVAIYEGKVRNGKAWEAFEAEHDGEIILRRGEIETVAAMRDAVMAHPIARELLAEGQGEVTIEWSMLGHRCRGRIDWLRPNGAIVEVKTTRKISRRAFAAEFGARFYHAQLAFYEGGLEAATGRAAADLPHVIAIENEPPYDVAVYRVGYDTLEAGQRKIDEWMRALDVCARSGVWPGVGAEILDLRLPDWALSEDVDLDLSGIGAGDHG